MATVEQALKDYKHKQQKIQQDWEERQKKRDHEYQIWRKDKEFKSQKREQFIQQHLKLYAQTVFNHVVQQVKKNQEVQRAILAGISNYGQTNSLLFLWCLDECCRTRSPWAYRKRALPEPQLPVPKKFFYANISPIGQDILEPLDKFPIEILTVFNQWCSPDFLTKLPEDQSTPFPGWIIGVFFKGFHASRFSKKLILNDEFGYGEPAIQINIWKKPPTKCQKFTRATRRYMEKMNFQKYRTSYV